MVSTTRRNNFVPVLELQGIRLHFIDEGAGTPLVFLHGFPLDHSMWDAQRREFRQRYRVIIPDLRGLGRSASNDEVVTMEQFADDVAGLLDALEISDPVTLCGLSMGGYIAQAFARRHSGKLGRLVLCDTRSQPDTPEAAENRLKLAEKVLQDGPRVIVEAMLPRLFGAGTNERRPAVVDAIRHVMLANSSRGIAAAQRGMAQRVDATPFLSQITVPTLVLGGELDSIAPPAEMRELAAAIPNSEFVEMKGVGHMAPQEDPAAFNPILQDWLSRTE